MTNQERQKSINRKYDSGLEKRGKSLWCTVCRHQISPKIGGCHISLNKASEQCICASAYNRMARGGRRK